MRNNKKGEKGENGEKINKKGGRQEIEIPISTHMAHDTRCLIASDFGLWTLANVSNVRAPDHNDGHGNDHCAPRFQDSGQITYEMRAA